MGCVLSSSTGEDATTTVATSPHRPSPQSKITLPLKRDSDVVVVRDSDVVVVRGDDIIVNGGGDNKSSTSLNAAENTCADACDVNEEGDKATTSELEGVVIPLTTTPKRREVVSNHHDGHHEEHSGKAISPPSCAAVFAIAHVHRDAAVGESAHLPPHHHLCHMPLHSPHRDDLTHGGVALEGELLTNPNNEEHHNHNHHHHHGDDAEEGDHQTNQHHQQHHQHHHAQQWESVLTAEDHQRMLVTFSESNNSNQSSSFGKGLGRGGVIGFSTHHPNTDLLSNSLQHSSAPQSPYLMNIPTPLNRGPTSSSSPTVHVFSLDATAVEEDGAYPPMLTSCGGDDDGDEGGGGGSSSKTVSPPPEPLSDTLPNKKGGAALRLPVLEDLGGKESERAGCRAGGGGGAGGVLSSYAAAGMGGNSSSSSGSTLINPHEWGLSSPIRSQEIVK